MERKVIIQVVISVLFQSNSIPYTMVKDQLSINWLTYNDNSFSSLNEDNQIDSSSFTFFFFSSSSSSFLLCLLLFSIIVISLLMCTFIHNREWEWDCARIPCTQNRSRVITWRKGCINRVNNVRFSWSGRCEFILSQIQLGSR